MFSKPVKDYRVGNFSPKLHLFDHKYSKKKRKIDIVKYYRTAKLMSHNPSEIIL